MFEEQSRLLDADLTASKIHLDLFQKPCFNQPLKISFIDVTESMIPYCHFLIHLTQHACFRTIQFVHISNDGCSSNHLIMTIEYLTFKSNLISSFVISLTDKRFVTKFGTYKTFLTLTVALTRLLRYLNAYHIDFQLEFVFYLL